MLNHKWLRKEKVMGQSLDSRDCEIIGGPTGITVSVTTFAFMGRQV